VVSLLKKGTSADGGMYSISIPHDEFVVASSWFDIKINMGSFSAAKVLVYLVLLSSIYSNVGPAFDSVFRNDGTDSVSNFKVIVQVLNVFAAIFSLYLIYKDYA
jgi:uncharacterized membrane protein